MSLVRLSYRFPCLWPTVFWMCLCWAHGETFRTAVRIPTGSDPATVSVGDFNRDGKPDLVYMDGFPREIHVLIGNGDGTFTRSQDITLPTGIGGPITVADVTDDGNPDLIMGSGGPDAEIAVLPGRGDGRFNPVVITNLNLNTSLYPAIGLIGVADLNGDGAMDVIAPDIQNSQIYVLLGNNTGAFTLNNVAPNFSGPSNALVGDFNGDGHADFVAHGVFGADATVYLGNGDGTFQTGVRYVGPNNITSIVLTDVDGDGHPDMVVGGFYNTIGILHGNPDGTFSNTSGGSSFGGPNPYVVAVHDFNGDGTLDITTISGNGISILFGKGGLAYQPAVPYPSGPSGSLAAMEDFDQDGNADFAGVVEGGLSLLMGKVDGTFESAETYDLGDGVVSLTIADFNRDSNPDLAVDVGSTGPKILLGNNDGTFRKPTATAASPLGTDIVVGDCNGDSKLDLAVGGTNSNGSVLFGNGDGTFFAPVALPGTVQAFSTLAVADFNHDGTSDIARPNYEALDILLGQTNRTFKALSSNIYWLDGFIAPAPADFNKDGRIDLALSVGSNLQIFLGNGDGTFAAGRILYTQLPGYSTMGSGPMAVADLDGDGNLDLVTAIMFYPIVEIFYGHGDGTFQTPPAVILTSRIYTSLLIGDVNSDGKPDLLLADSALVGVIHNSGARTFSAEVQYLAGSVNGFAIQDVNRDGAPDIVVANSGTTVSVLFNQPGGKLVAGSLSVQPEPSTVGVPFTVSLSLSAVSPGAGTPSGNVTFGVDGTPIGTVATVSGVATLQDNDTSGIGVGSHTVTASYGGDSAFLPANFSLAHVVIPVVHKTSIKLTVSPNPVVASNTVSCIATVTSPGQQPYGVVAFYDGTTTLGTGTLDDLGRAVYDTALLLPGTHKITAKYFGNENFAPAMSSPVSLVVTADPTAATLNVTPTAVQVGAMVALTSTVTSSAGTPTGATVFLDGSNPLVTMPLAANGSAVYSLAFQSPGTHPLSASYQANANFAQSTSNVVNLVVNGAGNANPTQSTLDVSDDHDHARGLILKASVRAPRGIPQGAVVFRDGTTELGRASLDANGTAIYQTGTVALGLHYLLAYYPGNSDFGPSISPAWLRDTDAGEQDFALNLSAVSGTATAGQPLRVQASVVSINGFASDVNLSCSAPQELSCAFQPGTVAAGQGTATLVITPLAGTRADAGAKRNMMAFLGVVCAPLLGLAGWRRNRLLACLAACIALAACGSAPTRAVESGEFVVAVSANSVGAQQPITHSIQLRVTVN